MNAGAYFHIRENKIKARYGLFGRIDCSMDEIEYALPRNNELIIGMKDGKHHTITEISNSYELSSAIRRQNFTLETETPDVLAAQLNENETSFNKRMIWMALGGGAVFIGRQGTKRIYERGLGYVHTDGNWWRIDGYYI